MPGMIQPQRNVNRIDENTLRVQIPSPHSGKLNVKELPITQAQWEAWQCGLLRIQQAMPHLSAADREWLMSGLTAEEWDELFGEED